MSSSDTFLEGFLDGITNLPYEVRRNLELIKELDKKFKQTSVLLKEAEDSYIEKTQQTILNFPLPIFDDDEVLVVPTTEELQAFVHNPEAMETIEHYRLEVKQIADEKVAVSNQTYSIIHSILSKLDVELTEYENLLRGTGEFTKAAATITPVPIPAIKNERSLKAGNFTQTTAPVSRTIKPNELCAIRVSPAQMADTEWILGRVISYNTDAGVYVVSDEDPEAIDKKKFNLPPTQVRAVGYDKVQKNDQVLAVYPDTTSFYQATVTQPPRKISGSSGNHPSNLFIHVQFQDDSDEFGVTHEKMIVLHHVMRLGNNGKMVVRSLE